MITVTITAMMDKNHTRNNDIEKMLCRCELCRGSLTYNGNTKNTSSDQIFTNVDEQAKHASWNTRHSQLLDASVSVRYSNASPEQTKLIKYCNLANLKCYKTKK